MFVKRITTRHADAKIVEGAASVFLIVQCGRRGDGPANRMSAKREKEKSARPAGISSNVRNEANKIQQTSRQGRFGEHGDRGESAVRGRGVPKPTTYARPPSNVKAGRESQECSQQMQTGRAMEGRGCRRVPSW